MSDPHTIGTAGLIGQAGGAVNSAVGSYFGAQSQQSSLQFQSDISGINAGIAQTNAQTLLTMGNSEADAYTAVGTFDASMANLGAMSAMYAGNQQAAQASLRAGQVEGTQQAAMAANGVSLGTGSAADVQASSQIVNQMNMDTIRMNAVNQAMGYRVQGMNAQMGAQIQAMNVRNSAGMAALNQESQAVSDTATSGLQSASASGINPFASASGTLLTGAGSVASNWYKLSQNTGTSAVPFSPQGEGGNLRLRGY